MDSIPYVIPESNVKPRVLTLVPNDPGSRYKTKQLQVQTVGKSKMIKSFFLNINEVAKTMQVPPGYIVHFIGYSIGTQAKYDPKKPERQQASLTGEHDTKDLSKWTLEFINEVLLCGNCGLPELLISIEKGLPCGSCRACGSSKPLPITNERFRNHIVKHPPVIGKGAFSGNEAGAKGDKKVGKKDKKSKKPVEEEEEEEEEEDDEDNVVWFSDTSAEAQKKRREQLFVDTEHIGGDEKPKQEEEVTQAMEKMSVKKEKKEKKEKRKEKEEKEEEESPLSLDMKKLLGEKKDISATIKKKDEITTLLSKHGQKQFLDWLTEFMTKEKSVAKIAHVVKDMYDEDLLEEENIISWNKENKNAAVKTNMAPLIKWFEEAEEESEEEEDDE